MLWKVSLTRNIAKSKKQFDNIFDEAVEEGGEVDLQGLLGRWFLTVKLASQ